MKRTNLKRSTKKVKKVRGFTLIEILIVVIILGILAAIVIPQFTNASTEAKQSSLASQLQTLRSQIGLYKLQHGDKAPPASTFWTVMSEQTDDAGTSPPADGTGPFGPYFDQVVSNPLTPGVTNVGAAASPATTDAWEYNADTGEIHGVATVSEDSTGAAITPMLSITDDGVKQATWSVAPN